MMIVYLSKRQKDLIQVFPVPEDLNNWVMHEVNDDEDYSSLEAVEVEGNWVIQAKTPVEHEEPTIDVELLRKDLANSIDDTASTIASYWTRFAEEYLAREQAALAFKKAKFQGEPSIWITAFATSAGLDNKTATQLILKQAEGLRKLQEQLGALRMRKYELKHPGLTPEQLQEIHDDVIEKMNALAEAQS